MPCRRTNRVIAVAANLPLEERQTSEAAMVEALAAMGKSGSIAGMQVMPPTRANSPESLSRALAESGADGALVMWLTDSETTESYVPPTVVGGYTVRKPRASYSAAFYDLNTGQQVWIAEMNSRGSAFSSFSDLAASAGQNTIKRLRADQVL